MGPLQPELPLVGFDLWTFENGDKQMFLSHVRMATGFGQSDGPIGDLFPQHSVGLTGRIGKASSTKQRKQFIIESVRGETDGPNRPIEFLRVQIIA